MESRGRIHVEKVKHELADVLQATLLLTDKYQFDADEIISKKLALNSEKYSIEKFAGSNKKYNEL